MPLNHEARHVKQDQHARTWFCDQLIEPFQPIDAPTMWSYSVVDFDRTGGVRFEYVCDDRKFYSDTPEQAIAHGIAMCQTWLEDELAWQARVGI